MSQAAERRLTVAEFLSWEGDPDTRYELIEGVPYAMAPPRWAHGVIVANLTRHLVEALDARPGCVVVVEAGIVLPSRHDTYYQSDLAVTCTAAAPDPQGTPKPLLIAEVLSPSTESHDRKVKLPDYRRIPSVQEVVLIDQDRPYCEVHRRLEADRWLTDLIHDLADAVELEAVGAVVPLAAIYRNVELDSGS